PEGDDRRPGAATEFALPAKIAAPFIRDSWERRPALISQPFAAPLISPEEVFRGIVEVADRYRAGEDDGSVRFYIEHAHLAADVEKHLPVLADRTNER